MIRTIAQGALALTLLIATLAIGGVHTPVAIVAVVLGVISGALALAQPSTRPGGRRAYVSATMCAAWLLALVAMLQTVPLPPWAHSLLHPAGLARYTSGAALLGLPAEVWRPLALDPALAADRALRWWALALVMFASANAFRRADHIRLLLWAVLSTGGAAVLVGLVQHLTGTTRVWGLYEARVAASGLSPFVSTNHASAFFGLCALCACALALLPSRAQAVSRVRELAPGLLAVIFAGLAIGHQSTGTTLALGVALATLGALELRRRGHTAPLQKLLGGLVALLVTGVGAAWALREHPLVAESLSYHSVRAEIMGAGLRASLAHGRLGAGAIERVIAPHVDWSAVPATTILTTENDLIDTLLLTGWPATLIALALLGWAARAWWRARGQVWEPTHTLTVALAVYLALISQVHFPTLALGLSLPAVATLEALLARSIPRAERGRHPHRVHHKLPVRHGAAMLLVALISAAAMGVLATRTYRVPNDEALSPAHPLTTATRDRIARLTPAEGRLYWRLAIDAMRETPSTPRTLERADVLAAHAWTLEPMPHVLHLRATIAARRGDLKAATTRYAQLMRAHPVPSPWLRAMLWSLPDAETRAAALLPAPKRWAEALAIVEARDPAAAAALGVALVERAESSAQAELLLMRHYRARRDWTMTARWARLLLLQRTTETTRRDASLALIEALRALKLNAEADAALTAALTERPEDPALLLETLRALPAPTSTPAPEQLERLRAAHRGACPHATRAQDQIVCARARAWIAEARGELDVAQDVLISLAWRLKDPGDLADFHERHGQCAQLQRFARRWAERVPERKAPPRLQAALGRCAR